MWSLVTRLLQPLSIQRATYSHMWGAIGARSWWLFGLCQVREPRAQAVTMLGRECRPRGRWARQGQGSVSQVKLLPLPTQR